MIQLHVCAPAYIRVQTTENMVLRVGEILVRNNACFMWPGGEQTEISGELFDRAHIEFTTVKSLHQINPEILIFVCKHSSLQIWPPKFQPYLRQELQAQIRRIKHHNNTDNLHWYSDVG